MTARRAVVALALAGALTGGPALAACGSSGGSHRDADVPSRERLRALLVTADDLPVRGFRPGSVTASGDERTTVAAIEFTRTGDEVSTSVSLIAAASPEAARALLPAQETGMGRDLVRVRRSPLPIGRNGLQVSGSSGDTGKPATQLFFVEGSIQVTVIVSGTPATALPAGFAAAVARAQDTRIRRAG